jgi:leucyl aminopeptidase
MSYIIFNFPQPFLDKKRNPDIPVIPLTEKTYKAWVKKQSASAQKALGQASFVGKPMQNYILRDEKGAVKAILAGVHTPCKYYDFAYTAEHVRAGLDADFLKKCSFTVNREHLSKEEMRRAHIGWGWACYQFTAYKKPAFGIPCLVLSPGDDKIRIRAFTESIYLLRNLINTPSNDMGPQELEDAAREVAKKFQTKIEVISGKELMKDFPMIHAVGQGSARKPRLIDMTWGNAKHPKVTLVGKGVCFDTGGLNLKPPQFMALMKKDMGGAAHTLGMAWIIMALKLPIRLRVLIPAVENAVSGEAYRPGDILQTRKGITVEIGDTDAEGRLVIADALTYACEEKPDLLLDCTTLTGSARAALGYDIPALFSNNEKTAFALQKLAMEYEDPMWPLPLWEPYRREMDTPYADINNIGAGKAGAIHGALFLKEFVPSNIEWVHLDMYAWEQYGRPGRPKGGADTGMRAAVALIEERYGKRK